MNAYPCHFHPGQFCVGATYHYQGKAARREAERMESMDYEDSVRCVTGACDVPI
jgi:hypothetical protein